jgi:hypothetical protein
MRYIFDLDHTVIDSSHRQLTKADGSLDLDHWIANNTRAKIMRDRLLPLARAWREQWERGNEIVVCTARVIGRDDLDYLEQAGLKYDAILSRKPGDRTPDGELKLSLLKRYSMCKRGSWKRFCAFSFMFDDNQSVIKTLSKHGIKCYNAIEINERLSA